MRSRFLAPALSLVILGATQSILTRCSTQQPADRSEELGEALGKAFLREASAFASAGVRARDGEAHCDTEGEGQGAPEVCAAELGVAAVLEEIDSAEQRGELPETTRYEGTHSYFMLQILASGLSSENALVRWNVLERFRWLCDYKTLLADAADDPCDRELEEACLKILSSDDDATNRLLALEILRSGYATDHAVTALNQIVRSTHSCTEKDAALRVLQFLGKR